MYYYAHTVQLAADWGDAFEHAGKWAAIALLIAIVVAVVIWLISLTIGWSKVITAIVIIALAFGLIGFLANMPEGFMQSKGEQVAGQQQANPQSSEKELGGVDLGSYCKSLGSVSVSPWQKMGKVGDWYCLRSDGVRVEFTRDGSPGWNEACRSQYGEKAHADPKTTSENSSPFDVKCLMKVDGK